MVECFSLTALIFSRYCEQQFQETWYWKQLLGSGVFSSFLLAAACVSIYSF